jgi:hypothetical protein
VVLGEQAEAAPRQRLDRLGPDGHDPPLPGLAPAAVARERVTHLCRAGEEPGDPLARLGDPVEVEARVAVPQPHPVAEVRVGRLLVEHHCESLDPVRIDPQAKDLRRTMLARLLEELGGLFEGSGAQQAPTRLSTPGPPQGSVGPT